MLQENSHMMEQLALFSQCKELRIGKCADEDYFLGGGGVGAFGR